MTAYFAVTTFLLLLLTANFLVNLLVFRRPRPARLSPNQTSPLVSILIPARNEETRLPDCLDSLLAQDYPHLEWIVLNDHSTDQTARVVETRRQREPRLRLIEGQDLPPGWTGKAWACHQLSREARGDYLLFTDADTRHEPQALSSALDHLLRHRYGLLSLWPRQIAVTWSERWVIPFVHVLILWFMPHWLKLRHRSLGAANGQFLLFRRDAYDAIHGHESVRSHLVEDVALGREILLGGHRLGNADGSHLVSCRMYESFGGIWEGFTKNLRAGFEDSLSGFIVTGILIVTLLILPFLWAFISWIAGWPAWIVQTTLAQAALVLLLRWLLAVRVGQPRTVILLHPLAATLCMAIALNSWIQTARGRVTWKGRTYTP